MPLQKQGILAAHKGYSSIGSQAARLARGLKLSGKRGLPGGVLQVPSAVSALGAVDCLYKAHGLTEGRRPERVMLLVPGHGCGLWCVGFSLGGVAFGVSPRETTTAAAHRAAETHHSS